MSEEIKEMNPDDKNHKRIPMVTKKFVICAIVRKVK